MLKNTHFVTDILKVFLAYYKLHPNQCKHTLKKPHIVPGVAGAVRVRTPPQALKHTAGGTRQAHCDIQERSGSSERLNDALCIFVLIVFL